MAEADLGEFLLMSIMGWTNPSQAKVYTDYIEQMETAIAQGGPGSAIKMQGLRDLLHENTRTAGRLVSRMSDRSHVSVDKTVQHIIIGWANEDGTVKSIENKSPPLISPVERCR